MKKQDKINCLHQAVGTYDLCRCYFHYDAYYRYYYILDYSDKLMFGVEEDDFILDGFSIRRISDIKKIGLKDDLCVQINREKKLLDGVIKPEVDVSSWKSALESLERLNYLLIIENENPKNNDGFFYIGRIKEIGKSAVIFAHFDADGIWYDDVEIPYSKITGVTFGDRYSTTWQEYLSIQ